MSLVGLGILRVQSSEKVVVAETEANRAEDASANTQEGTFCASRFQAQRDFLHHTQTVRSPIDLFVMSGRSLLISPKYA